MNRTSLVPPLLLILAINADVVTSALPAIIAPGTMRELSWIITTHGLAMPTYIGYIGAFMMSIIYLLLCPYLKMIRWIILVPAYTRALFALWNSIVILKTVWEI